MRVGLNATCLNDRPSGAKQRFAGIYGALFSRLSDVDFVIFEPQDCRVAAWFDGFPNVSARVTSVPSEGRLGKFTAGVSYWPNAFSRERLDIFEGFHLPLTRSSNGKTMLTIHDVRGLHSDNGIIDRAVFGTVLRRSLQMADHVITVSEAMRTEILNFFPNTPVSVVYNGLDPDGFAYITSADCEAFRAKYALPSGFALAIGHFEKRKNYLRLIDAIAVLKARSVDCPLLIIGNNSGERKAVEERIAAARLTGQVTLCTGLTDHEVRCAYKLCSLFVFPSAYEGFGIPILEAMAAQRPMVLSDLPVFREITEDHSIYFQHDDVEAIANAVELGLTGNTQRSSMVEYGNRRVEYFGFEKLANQLAAVYERM
jgi:glycosyltransferase involved in cell wall biosynthesis